jgi:hypothetical protein
MQMQIDYIGNTRAAVCSYRLMFWLLQIFQRKHCRNCGRCARNHSHLCEIVECALTGAEARNAVANHEVDCWQRQLILILKRKFDRALIEVRTRCKLLRNIK